MPYLFTTAELPIAVKDAAESFINLVKNLGWSKAITILLFFFFVYIIKYLLHVVLDAKDKEIFRLVKDNEAYRAIYLQKLDASRGVKPVRKKIPPKP